MNSSSLPFCPLHALVLRTALLSLEKIQLKALQMSSTNGSHIDGYCFKKKQVQISSVSLQEIASVYFPGTIENTWYLLLVHFVLILKVIDV